jgi:hypothetical protein
MKSIVKQINAIRDAMLAGSDFPDLLGKFLDKHGDDAIVPLLLIHDFPEEMSDEKYSITHAVESFARETYVSKLVATAPAMSEFNPSFLDFLLARLLNSSREVPLFMERLGSANGTETVAIKDSIVRVRSQYPDKPKIVRSCKTVAAAISRR